MGISQNASYILWLVVACMSYGLSSFAAVESRYSLKGQNLEASLSLKTELFAETSLFVNSNNGEFRKSSHGQINKLGLSVQGEDDDFLYGQLEFSGDLINSDAENFFYINLVKLNWQKKLGPTRLFLGRKTHVWSKADQVWMNGLWQPTYSWSKLRPEQNGLTGAHLQWAPSSDWSLYAFVSPIYLPSLGVRQRVVDGKFQAANPWFIPPAQNVNLPFKKDAEIYYETDIPEISEIIFRPSAGAQAQWEGGKPYARLSYAYKPMNYIYQSADVSIRYDLPSSPPGVNVVPRFANHHLITGEIGVKKTYGWQGWLSLTGEHPEELDLEPEWTYNRTGKATILASEVSYDLDRNNFVQDQVYLGYQKVWGGDQGDGGEFGNDESSLFEKRFEYYDAIKLGYRNDGLRLGTWPLAAMFEMTYDELQKGFSLVSGSRLFFTSKMSVFLRADFIALAAGGQPKIKSGFLDSYKANDEVSLGVSYVF